MQCSRKEDSDHEAERTSPAPTTAAEVQTLGQMMRLMELPACTVLILRCTLSWIAGVVGLGGRTVEAL